MTGSQGFSALSACVCGWGVGAGKGGGVRREKETSTRTKMGHRAPSRPDFMSCRPGPVRLSSAKRILQFPSLNHSGAASQTQPPAKNQSQGAMQITSSALQTRAGLSGGARCPAPSFLPAPPPLTSLRPEQLPRKRAVLGASCLCR